MVSVNIGVFGSNPVERQKACSSLGKKGAPADITFFDNVFSGLLLSVIEPTAYPEKLQPALFAAQICDYPVLLASEVNQFLGELIVLLDLTEKQGAIIGDLDVSQFTKGTNLENWRKFSSVDEFRASLIEFKQEAKNGELKAWVDHSFEVKGIGNVALGVVKCGEMNVHDKLKVFPSKEKTIEVRSIQMHDEDVKQAKAGDRFGIAFKGLDAKELERGSVLAKNAFPTHLQAKLKIRATKYLKEPIKAGEVLHACVGLQFIVCKIGSDVNASEQKEVELVFEKPIAMNSTDSLVLARINSKGLRVVSVGKI